MSLEPGPRRDQFGAVLATVVLSAAYNGCCEFREDLGPCGLLRSDPLFLCLLSRDSLLLGLLQRHSLGILASLALFFGTIRTAKSGHPLAGVGQGQNQGFALLMRPIHCSVTCATLSACSLNRARFLTPVGCEPNRARHPSGSSGSRCSAIALAACAAPEKRWCQAVSMGITLRMAVAVVRQRQSVIGSWLGRLGDLHSS